MDMDDEAVKQAAQQACVDMGLPLFFRSVVSQMLRTPSSEWPACCGNGGCDPCSFALTEAALRARDLLAQRSRPKG